jgi:hypothetical protein
MASARWRGNKEDIPGFRIVFDKMTDMWICQCMAMYYRPPPGSSMTILEIMTSSHRMSNNSLVRLPRQFATDAIRRFAVYTYDLWFVLFKVSLPISIRSDPLVRHLHLYARTPCAFSVWASSTTAFTDAISAISSTRRIMSLEDRQRWSEDRKFTMAQGGRWEKGRKKGRRGLTERRTQFNTSQCFNWFIFFDSPYDLVISFWEVHILYIS